MIETTNPERVRVTKNGRTPYDGVTTHYLYGVTEKDGRTIRGSLLGIGIRDDRGFDTYAQPDQIEVLPKAA
jgi:hypothetical protein